ncbi:MAG: sugar ABC transporter permease [Saccharospirillaceae bacterium]|nr:hypothetical protein [Pseudomonadales bacterium]NRB78466.1 sugar ABC transporter permease [Saccharospirillaceae bacterium]
MIRSNIGNNWVPYVFLMPFLSVFILFYLYPTYSNIYVSFHDYSPYEFFDIDNFQYVAMWNYIDIFNSDRMLKAILSSIIYLIAVNLILHSLALMFAKMINLTFKSIQVVVLILLLLPYLSDGLVVFSGLAVSNYNIDQWVVFAWSEVVNNLGFYIFVYYIVLERVPTEVKEAALLDGASTLKCFMKIEIPALLLVIKMMLLLSTVYLIQDSPINNGFVGSGGGFISAFTVLFTGLIILLIVFISMFKLLKKYKKAI